MPKKVKDGKIQLSHAQLKRQIVDYLRWYKWLVIPINQGPFAYDGIADLYIIKYFSHGNKYFSHGNYQIWLEIKVGKDKQSKAQSKFEIDIINQGGRYWLVKSLEDLESYLRDYGLLQTKPIRERE